MIHLHNALSSEIDATTTRQNARSPLTDSTLDNFHGALSDAVSSTLEKFGIQSHDLQISISRSGSSSDGLASGDSGAPTRVTRPSAGSSGEDTTSSDSSSSASGPPDGGYDPFLQASYNWTAAGGSSAQGTPETVTAPLDAQQTFDNAYWAEQPPAVQALRNIQDPAERAQLATQLAGEGYSIDVPIMVWGWDPSIVTSMRQADGYTWVPSALQNGVEMAPGLPSVGNELAYNPNQPPSGSIAV